MQNFRLRVTTLLALTALLLSVGRVWASVGLLIDPAGRVDGARFENSVRPLVEEISLIPVAIVHDGSPEGEEGYVYEQRLLKAAGYYDGDPTDQSPVGLNPYVVAIAIDYGGGNLNLYLADYLATKYDISQSDREMVIDQVAKYAREDPTKALEAGFGAVRDLMDPPFNRSLRALLSIAPYVLAIALLVMTIWWLVARLMALATYRRQVGVVLQDYADVRLAFEGGEHKLSELLDMLRVGFKDEVEELNVQALSAAQAMASITRDLDALAAIKVGLTTSDSQLARLLAQYQAAKSKLPQVEAWVVKVSTKLDEYQKLESGADDLLTTVNSLLTATRDGYATNCGRYGNVLPDKDNLFGAMEKSVTACDDLIHMQGQALMGGRRLQKLQLQLEKFGPAIEAVMHAVDLRAQVIEQANRSLAPWLASVDGLVNLNAGVDVLVKAAIQALTDDDDLEDVREPAEAAVRAYSQFQEAVARLAQVLANRDTDLEEIGKLLSLGHRDQTKSSLAGAAQNLREGIAALAGGRMVEATNSLALAEGGFERVRHDLAAAEDQRQANISRLEELSKQAAKVQEARQKILPTWTILTGNFRRENWDGLGNSMTAVIRGLAAIFADPSDASSVRGRINDLNDWGCQQWSEASAALDTSFRDLAEYGVMLKAIEDRYKAVVDAKDNLGATIVILRRLHGEAAKFRDDHDPDIGSAIDQILARASESIGVAQGCLDDGRFLAGADAATFARRNIDDALAKAKQAVASIASARAVMNTTRGQVGSALAKAGQEINDVLDVIVSPDTQGLLADAQRAYDRVQASESALAGLEDDNLEAKLVEIRQAYEGIGQGVSRALDSLRADQRRYTQALEVASNGWSVARDAVEEAQERTSHSDAGSAGDGDAASAADMLGAKPKEGDSAITLQTSTKRSARACELAQAAISAANRAISAAQAERARLARIAREKAEAAERVRQQALEAAREAARREERRREDAERARRQSSSSGGASRPPSSSPAGRSSGGTRTSTPASGGSRTARKF